MRLFWNLWVDEAGFIVSAELVLIATILVIGMIVGLVSVRNQIVQEFVDIGQAIGSVSQTFAYGGINKPGMAMTDGCFYVDLADFCQNTQTAGHEPGGIVIAGNYPSNAPQVPPNGESDSWNHH